MHILYQTKSSVFNRKNLVNLMLTGLTALGLLFAIQRNALAIEWTDDKGELCWHCEEELGDPKELLLTIYDIGYPVAIILGLLLIGVCGYKVMMSHGDPRQLQDAQECITSAIIGIVFIGLSATILRLVISSFITSV